MGRLEELEKQQETIANAIAEEKAKVCGDAVEQVCALIKKHGITLSEVKNVLTMRKPRAKGAAKVSDGAPKKRGRPRKNG